MILECAARPSVPGAVQQKDVAVFITDLAAAHGDCRDKLGDVRAEWQTLKEIYGDDVSGELPDAGASDE